ncbi:hypothetical protein F8M41_017144 [Gigaspora margarita]|uniref:Uncharacterized protein n=1 Tax=Gigaspora margarita TaxID=4874 RepID=A0A8H4AND3_GIGMA|nr:hypothetical protein F8M41_017144 [Gigaspora margarita]
MIPRQSRQISFYDEYVQTVPVDIHRWMLGITYIFATAIYMTFCTYDYNKSNAILEKQSRLENNTDLNGIYGNDSKLYDAVVFSDFFYCFYIFSVAFACGFCCRGRERHCDFCSIFMLNILGACISIPHAFPYLKDQIVGPDHQIISCNHIENLDSWLNDWCTFHKHRIILSWSLIFVWFITYPIYLFIILVILGKRVYRILKLWTIYQYQYRKGLFLTWLENRKEKSMQQNEIVTDNKSVKEVTTYEIKIVAIE